MLILEYGLRSGSRVSEMLLVQSSVRLYLPVICLFCFEHSGTNVVIRGVDCNTRLVQASKILPSGGISDVGFVLRGIARDTEGFTRF